MSEQTPPTKPMRRWHFNSIWLVPLVALAVAGWMLYQNWASQGQLIEIIAPNAEGITAGKTKVKARNVDVGSVKSIHLSDDYSHAVIQVQMNADTYDMLNKDTKFWVIKPRIGREGVSGLGTILSGAYIEMEPGKSGSLVLKYKMLSQPPLSTQEDQGIRLRLRSHGISKMDVGTPVHFNGYEVGYIEEVGFDPKTADITYRVFIHAPYDKLVNSSVQFWLTPGFQISSSVRGVQVKMDSLETFLSGGISFGITKGKAGHSVADLSQFHLYKSREDAENNRYDQFIHYVFLFDSNISGLTKGAPVEFRGIRIGTVEQVPYAGSSFKQIEALNQPAIPVLARIEPQRLDKNFQQKIPLDQWKKLLNKQIKHGLRASLETSNLLTGAKLIDLNFQPNADPVRSKMIDKYPSFPTVPGKIAQMQDKVNQVLSNLAKAPVNQTFKQLQHTLQGASSTANSMRKTSEQLQHLLKQANQQQLPLQLKTTLEQLQHTLTQYQSQGEVGNALTGNMRQLQQSLRQLQSLLQQLQAQPNSLIFDHPQRKDVRPGGRASQH